MKETRSAWLRHMRAAREGRGLSRNALAREIGVSHTALGRWETGAGLPNRDNAAAWAAGLGEELPPGAAGWFPAAHTPGEVHGTARAYFHCRKRDAGACADCRAANSAAVASHRARRAAA